MGTEKTKLEFVQLDALDEILAAMEPLEDAVLDALRRVSDGYILNDAGNSDGPLEEYESGARLGYAAAQRGLTEVMRLAGSSEDGSVFYLARPAEAVRAMLVDLANAGANEKDVAGYRAPWEQEECDHKGTLLPTDRNVFICGDCHAEVR